MLFGKKISFNQNDFGSVIEACIANDQQAQRHLYKLYFGYAKSICLRYTACTEEAEEVMNEGFLKVFRNLERYDVTCSFKTWLRTIMVNTAISYFRKNKKFSEDRISLEDTPYLSFDEDIVAQITSDEILDLVQQLKPVYKNVFLLHVVDGYNHREIAQMLEINEATVRSHFVRARTSLKGLISRAYPHLEYQCAS